MTGLIKPFASVVISWFAPGSGHVLVGRTMLGMFLFSLCFLAYGTKSAISAYGDVRTGYAMTFFFHPSGLLYSIHLVSSIMEFLIQVGATIHALLLVRGPEGRAPAKRKNLLLAILLLPVSYTLIYVIQLATGPKIVDGKYAVTIGGVGYLIPVNYISSISFFKRGEVEHITMELLYPEMEPRTEENAAEFSEPGFGRRIRMLIEDGVKERDAKNIIEANINADEIDFSVNGLQALSETRLDSHDNEYAFIKEGKPRMLLTCYGKHYTGFHGYCFIYIDIESGVYMQASISDEYLGQIGEVYESIDRLFDGFLDATITGQEHE